MGLWLLMLQAVQDAAEAEAWTPKTPVWHAPLIASSFAGFTLVNHDSVGWAIGGAIVGALAMIISITDQLRRQRVTPGRIKKPARTLAFFGFILVVTLCVVIVWQRFELPDDFVGAARAVGWRWLITTAMFAVGITATNRFSARWTAAPT